MQSNQDKFKQILLVPNIIQDKLFIQRRKTFQTYVKKAHSDLYYLQLKKIGGLQKSISEKADYGQIIHQTKTNRLSNEYLSQEKKNQGFMYNNQLWSNKYYTEIMHMTKLSKLSDMLLKQKIKSQDQLISDFQSYFTKHIISQDEYNDQQKIIQNSNQTTKCNSRINSPLKTSVTDRQTLFNNRLSYRQNSIYSPKKILQIIDEANIAHSQNLKTFQKVKDFKNQLLPKEPFEKIQQKRDQEMFHESIKYREINFRNKFVKDRLIKDLEQLINQNQ